MTTETNYSVVDATTATHNVGIIDDDIMQYVYTINLSIICSVVALFGIVTNSINIVIFLSQSFQETINISLLGLAISDLCTLIPLLWIGICYNPYFMYSKLPVLTIDLQHFPGGWTHVIFTRVTGFITVFITFERFLCVAFPLKVKNILTPERVKIIIVAMYVFVIASMSPLYSIFYFGWRYVESLNRTVLGNINLQTSDKLLIRTMGYYMQLIYVLFSFIAVVICTYLLVSKINQRGKWRQSTTTSETNTSATIRDRQVVKMVIHVACIFIISYIPALALFAIMLSVPGMNNGEENDNLFKLTYSISFMLEGINSSVNIFIYYKTSSKYKQQFDFRILGIKKSCHDKKVKRTTETAKSF